MKKALAIFLSSSMIFAMFSGCSNTAATHSATQTGEKKKIKFSMAVTEQQKADAENAIARFECFSLSSIHGALHNAMLVRHTTLVVNRMAGE